MKDKDCEKLKEEIFFLKKEVDLLNKNLKSLGYESESSSKNDANPNASNNKDVRKTERNIDAPSSSKSKEKSQDNYGRNPTPRRYADGVKDARGNGYYQRIPRQKDFRSKSRKSSSPRYQSIFLGYSYSCTNFGHMAKDCRAYLQETILQEVMNSYS